MVLMGTIEEGDDVKLVYSECEKRFPRCKNPLLLL
jgi:hypothetical protein